LSQKRLHFAPRFYTQFESAGRQLFTFEFGSPLKMEYNFAGRQNGRIKIKIGATKNKTGLQVRDCQITQCSLEFDLTSSACHACNSEDDMLNRGDSAFRIFNPDGQRRISFASAATGLTLFGTCWRDDHSLIEIKLSVTTSNIGLVVAARLLVSFYGGSTLKLRIGIAQRRDRTPAGGLCLEALSGVFSRCERPFGRTLLVQGTASFLVHGDQRTTETSKRCEFVRPTLANGLGMLVASRTFTSSQTCDRTTLV
jgi:hypothetical protein